MKMKPIIYLFAVTTALLMFSCSDDSKPTAESFNYRDYLPLDSGNLWKYDYFAIDQYGSDYNAPFGRETQLATDSIMYLGRNAIIIKSEYVNNGNTTSKEYLYSKDSNQFAISGLELKVHDSLSVTEDNWITIYDLDQYTGPWINGQIEFNDIVINDSKYYGTINIEGSMGAKTKIELEGERFEAFSTKLQIYYNIERKRSADTVFITKREEYEYRFAKEIGIIYRSFKIFQDTTFISGNKMILSKREF